MLCHSIMHKTIKSMWDCSGTKIDIRELATLFENKFSPSEQHDAHEFFVQFCNMLQEEVNG